MNTTQVATPSAVSPMSNSAPVSVSVSTRRRRWRSLAVRGAVFVALGVTALIFRNPLLAIFQSPPPLGAAPREEVVSVTSDHTLTVAKDVSLAERLRIAAVGRVSVDVPVLSVTGSIVARLPAGADQAESRWDFAAPEIATAYGDWIKARADVAFYEGQAAEIRKLADARTQQATVEVTRLEKLVKIGTEAERDLVTARFNLQQTVIQGRKDVFEADTGVRNAIRNRGLLERQLLQAGFDPDLLETAKDGLVLVVADVPEAKIGLLEQLVNRTDTSRNKPCRARFFSFPETTFAGRVGRVGPSLSKEKRTLRVTFELSDPADRLLPGMFAEIGLGTQHREVLTVPPEAVLHAGDHDYVLVEVKPHEYQPRRVQVDEPLPVSTAAHSGQMPILHGVALGERVVADGAILLKPVLVKSLNGNCH